MKPNYLFIPSGVPGEQKKIKIYHATSLGKNLVPRGAEKEHFSNPRSSCAGPNNASPRVRPKSGARINEKTGTTQSRYVQETRLK